VKKEREIFQTVLGLHDSYLTSKLKHSKSDIETKSNAPLKSKSSLRNKDIELEGILIEYIDETPLDDLSPLNSKVRSPFGSSAIVPIKKKLDVRKPHVRNKSQIQINNNNSSAKSNLEGISIESFDIFK
jgi:hypothetical protein